MEASGKTLVEVFADKDLSVETKVLTALGGPFDVDKLQDFMLEQEQVSCPVYHHFSPGLYVREVNIPAGTIAIGHRQKKEHLNILLKGRVTITDAEGNLTEMKAPMIFTGQPGRKCGYIHEDMVWLNVYPTDETDIAKLEAEFLDQDPDWQNDINMDALNRLQDREDYALVLKEYGFTEEIARAQSEYVHDQIPFPAGSWAVRTGLSTIEGTGLFATGNMKEKELIPMLIGGKRTPAGRYTNHAKAPNATVIAIGDDRYLQMLRDIEGSKGGRLGEEITIDYRVPLELRGIKKCQQ